MSNVVGDKSTADIILSHNINKKEGHLVMGCPSFMRYYMAREIMITVEGVKLPCPSAYEWSLQDVSAGESGK